MKIFPVKFLILFFVRMYQFLFSPFLTDSCRFTPSCSYYAIRAVEKHGTLNGLVLSIRRILRCNPFCNKTGYDPVP